MRQVIRDFLAAQKTEEFKNDTDKWKDYPITFVNGKKELEVGFIQDAFIKVKEDTHHLNLVIMRSDYTVFTFHKICKVPEGCPGINWDTLHCPFDVDLYN